MQRVNLGNNVSDWQNVCKDSTQGLIMGPWSYNMFTNDMFMILDDDVEVYNYADDNSLISAGFNVEKCYGSLLGNRLVNLGISKQQHLYLKTKNLI